MIKIDIFVVGDVDPDKAAEAVGQLPFEPRETAHNGLGKLSIIPTSSPLVSFLMKKYRIILIV